jgi:hypothetical protein
MYYISTADKLQRTAQWLEKLDGGIEYLKSVIVEDRLGICDEFEKQMQALASSYFCEWTEVVKNPERWKQVKQFANSDEVDSNIEFVEERGQKRPADWKPDAPAGAAAGGGGKGSDGDLISSPPVTPSGSPKVVIDSHADEEPPNVFNWKEEAMYWVDVGIEADFPLNGGMAVKVGDVQVAVFRILDADGEEKWYATQNVSIHTMIK